MGPILFGLKVERKRKERLGKIVENGIGWIEE